MITLSGVTKTYKMGRETIYALHHVDLKIKTGEFVAIVGPSGSGKTTLANSIGGLDIPDAGTIIIDDQDITRSKNDTLLSNYRNKKVGFIFQTFNLLPYYSAVENVSVPLVLAHVPPHERRLRAANCLKAVGLADRASHKPSELSGGERQRVAIARALANNPAIIIADEPTGNLDSTRSKEIIDLLMQLQKQQRITLIVITHDPTIAKQADRVVAIRDGEVH